MKRPIVIVAMIYAAGLCASPLLRVPPPAAIAAVALIAASQAVALALGRRASDPLLFAAVFTIGLCRHEGIARDDLAARLLLERFEGEKIVRVEGRLASTGRSYKSVGLLVLKDCTISAGNGEPAEFPTMIQLVCAGGALEKIAAKPPSPGDRVVAEGRIEKPPDLRNPDVFNYRAYLESRGIGASIFARDAGAVRFGPPPKGRSPREWLLALGERLRRRSESVLESSLDRESAALIRSVFLGQAQRLDYNTRRNFVPCGLAHVFAVSGLHIGILLWVLDTFVRLFGPRPAVRSIVLIAALWVFCAMVGFRASAVRASVMFSALLASHFLGYKVEPLTALAAAALVILGANPRALHQAGFQLSLLAMASVILLKPPLDGWLRLNEEKENGHPRASAAFVNRHVLSYLTLVIAAQVGVLPFLAQYYHRIPLLGILSNLAAAPLVWTIIATTVLLHATAAVFPWAAGLFADALALFSHILLGLVRLWSKLPAVSILTPPWPIWAGAGYYLLLFGWAILPREPSPFFEARQKARLWIAMAAVAAWVAWAPIVLGGAGGGLRATFLDVGQGDSCVVELPAGAVVLVDGGDSRIRAGEFVVVPFLESRGIEHIDAVIATHPDSDHVGGLLAVFRDCEVDWLIEGPGRGKSRAYRRLVEAAVAEGAKRYTVYAGDWIEAPMGARVVFLSPRRGAAYSQLNNLSLAFMIDWRDCEILMVGDIERAAERDLTASGADLECDVLKVAHHGSASATSAAFLARAKPQLAVISCGRNNPYGHPRPEVLERLTSAGAAIARTDRDGAVTVWCDGRRLFWRKEGKP